MNKLARLIGRVALALVLVIFGAFLSASHSPLVAFVDSKESTLSEAETGVNLDSFWKAWHLIDEQFPDAEKTDDTARVDGAISGLVSSLGDPFSEYFNPEETKSFEESISGEFGGLGIELDMKDGILTVIAPLKGSPAERAGIQKGDKIYEADKKSLQDLKIDEAIALMRGEPGTTVTLGIIREGEKQPLEVSIVREIIHVPTVDTKFRDDGVFVISLYNFYSGSDDLFMKALKEFSASGSKKLVIDLRGNPGGYLESAVNIASALLPKDDLIVKEIPNDPNDSKEFRSSGFKTLSSDVKIAVVVDRGSASASEILAGALQDHKRATLVGEKTYGKGSVQQVMDLTKDTILKLTIAHWYTPNGTSISKTGLTPDVEVKYVRDSKVDDQLEKAVELLKK